MPARLQLLFAILGTVSLAPVVVVAMLPAASGPHHWLVYLTAWLSCLWWFVSAGCWLSRGPTAIGVAWFVLSAWQYLVHVVVAFHLTHGWSHNAAFAHVESASGFGPGIWVSYFVTVCWTLEASCMLLKIRRPIWARVAFHTMLGCMVFSGTVVYGLSWFRVAGVFGFLILLLIWWNPPRSLPAGDTAEPGLS